MNLSNNVPILVRLSHFLFSLHFWPNKEKQCLLSIGQFQFVKGFSICTLVLRRLMWLHKTCLIRRTFQPNHTHFHRLLLAHHKFNVSLFLRWRQYWQRRIWSRLKIPIVTNCKWNLLPSAILATSRLFVRYKNKVKPVSPLYCLNLAILRQLSYLLALMDVCESSYFMNVPR